jgi:hypothetical protein
MAAGFQGMQTPCWWYSLRPPAPVNPMYSGTGDVTFALLAPGGAVITSVTIHHLTINGPI